jgi:hypothetical protein
MVQSAQAVMMPRDYEPFAYSGTVLNGQNGGTGWNGAWFQTGTSPSDTLSNDGVSLSYPVTFQHPGGTPPTTGSRVRTGGQTVISSSSRMMSQTFNLGQNGVMYVSALIRKNAANGGGVSNDNILLEFVDAGGNRRFGLGIEGNGDRPWVNSNGVGQGATAVTPGSTYFLVAKMEASAAPTPDVAKLWVYGAGYANQVPILEPVLFDASASFNGAALLDRIRVRIDQGNTAAAPGEVDEIRIGATWASVTAVPEPLACLVWLGMIASAAIVRRRLNVNA